MNDRYLYKGKIKGNLTGHEELDWAIGNLIIEQSTGKHFIIDLSHFDESTRLFDMVIEVDPSTICQCTAMPDKNGKKIYEKNIVRYEDGSVGIVEFGVWNNYSIGFYIRWLSGNAKFYRNELGYWAPKVEVIGSAIDNPELLEVGE